MNKVAFWLNNARKVALPQSVMPAILAVCLAVGKEGFSILSAVAAVVGVACAHLCVNLLDDYFDYKNAGIESRQQLQRAGMRARIAKATYLADGSATLAQTFRAASVFGVIALAMGCICWLIQDWHVMMIAAIGGLLGYSYSGKPLMLCYRGLGEIVTGLIFGPLLMLGVYYAACGALRSEVWLMSVAVGLLVINILYTHSIMDRDADISVGKTTLAVMLPSPKAQLAAEWCFTFLPFVIIICGVVLQAFSPWMLLTLLTLPMACSLFKMMRCFFSEPKRRFEPKPWMGAMPNWKTIVEADLDWFMIRWYLSRNYLTLFMIVAAVVALCTH
ncbi:MAG: prenyltransferase [Bacteroidales bacterium]|nr:prenyltransferase [Bacteroidales bacterium]